MSEQDSHHEDEEFTADPAALEAELKSPENDRAVGNADVVELASQLYFGIQTRIEPVRDYFASIEGITPEYRDNAQRALSRAEDLSEQLRGVITRGDQLTHPDVEAMIAIVTEINAIIQEYPVTEHRSE